jgi:hypothetical protein
MIKNYISRVRKSINYAYTSSHLGIRIRNILKPGNIIQTIVFPYF